MDDLVLVHPNRAIRVLLVEDDEAQREVVVEILQLEGISVTAVATLDEVEQALASDPDVVLMDLHGIASKEIARTVRQHTPPPALVVVSGDHRVAELARELGAQGYLPKPYEVEDLLRAIQAALSGSEHEHAPS